MKYFITILAFIVLGLSQKVNAQLDIKKVQEANNAIYNNVYRPRLQQIYDSNMNTGNFLLSVGKYKKALKYFNAALKVAPNSSDALERRDYCRSMLKK